MNKFSSHSRFTLFIVLPWDEVCSVRNLPSGVTVQSIYCRLELLAGCPACTYRLVSPEGKVLQDDQCLVLSVNVWDGYMVRVQPLDKWIPVYDGVQRGNLDLILSHGRGGKETGSDQMVQGLNVDGTDRGDDVGAVALYLSCWLGHNRLSAHLLDHGVDPNTVTPFGRSPMFACIVKDNETLLGTLMSYGAKSDLRDFQGDSVLDVGKASMSRQCVNLIHSFHINHLQQYDDDDDTVNSSRNTDFEIMANNKYRNTNSNVKTTYRRTQSAKITMSSNAGLVKKLNNTSSTGCNTKLKTKSACKRDTIMLRSNTYSNGFSLDNNNKTTTTTSNPQVHTTTSKHPVPYHHASQALSTPRSLRYFPEVTSSRTSTPRSSSGMATLRVASPKSKHPSKSQTTALRNNNNNNNNINNNSSNNNNNRVKWIEMVAYPEIQHYPTHSQTRNNYAQDGKAPNALSNSQTSGTRDSNQTRHFIGPSSSPRDIRSPQFDEKSQNDHNIVIQEEDDEEEKENGHENTLENCSDGNGAENEKEHSGEKQGEAKAVISSIPKRHKIWKSRKQMEMKRKEKENLDAAKRRIQLLENQKRYRKKRESFEQWLKKKQRQQRQEESTDDSDDSSEDEKERKRNNDEAFNNWLKELDQRSIKQTNPNSAISLHKRKTRAIKGLIGISNNSAIHENEEIVEDSSEYMHSYQKWLDKKSQDRVKKPELREFDERKARRYLKSMRNDVLAEAVSFDEWVEHAEDRKRLTEIISQSKRRLSEDADNQKRSQSAKNKKNNVTFEKWKQELEAKEAKQKIAQLRMRREQEKEKQMRENDRVSTAIPHDAWVQKKLQEGKQEKFGQGTENFRQVSAKGRKSAESSEDGSGNKKQVGFETWVNKKHETELQRVNENIQREQELLEETRQKK